MCVCVCVRVNLHACVHVLMLCICDVCHAPAGMKEQRCYFSFNSQDSMMWQSGGEKCNPTSVRVLSTKVLLWATVIGFHAVE